MSENPAKKSTSQSPRLRQARIKLRGPLSGEEHHDACQVIEATLGPQAHYALNLREREGIEMLNGEQLKAWYMRHLTTCPSCRRNAMHRTGHANSNTVWLHCIRDFYLPLLARLADVEITIAARVLDGLSAIPLYAESIRRRAQEVRAGKE
jgi:hypothetical protein